MSKQHNFEFKQLTATPILVKFGTVAAHDEQLTKDILGSNVI